jgi:hypothetical protein
MDSSRKLVLRVVLYRRTVHLAAGTHGENMNMPRIGLTLRSTRTQPQAAESCHPGCTFASSSLISSAAAGPVSVFR